MTRLKIATVAAFMAVGIASVGVFAIGAGRPDEPRRVMSPTADALKPPAADKRNAAAPAEMIEVRGRIVDPDGRPVAGAAVRAGHLDREIKPEPSARSGPDGRFTMRVPPCRLDSMRDRRDASYPWVIASAAGFGPGWASAVREPGAPGELTIQLVEEGLPLEGRIVDLEGRPVSGARVKAESIWSARKGRVIGLATDDLGGKHRRALGRTRRAAGDDDRRDRRQRSIPDDGDRPLTDSSG